MNGLRRTRARMFREAWHFWQPGNSGRGIAGGPSDHARTKRRQQQPCPSRRSKRRHETVPVEAPNESKHEPNAQSRMARPPNRALKMVQCAQTRVLATYTIRSSEEMR